MSSPLHIKTGEKSETFDIVNRSASPAINLQFQLSCKDASIEHLPDPFKPRPKLSRTPPNTTDIDNANNNNIEDIKTDNSETFGNDTYQSSKFHSPSVSIEYPPGSTIPVIKKRKKFQFKKSHYQRFIGTSSAKKTKEIKKNMERQNSISNSITSYQSSTLSYDIVTPQHVTNNNFNVTNTIQINNESLPPSPPSDDIISTLSKQSIRKLPRHIIHSHYKINNFISADKYSNGSNDSEVSSSPSMLEYSNTATTTHTKTTTTHNYSYTEYKSRQHWTTLVHAADNESNYATPKGLATTPTVLVSRANFAKNKPKRVTFGSNKNIAIDTDKIRMALHEYENKKGQNLEEIFKPQKTCCSCILL